MNRVVITGIGIVSCLGRDPETIAQKLYKGESAVQVDPLRLDLGFRSPLTTRIPDFDPSHILSRKARKTMTDFTAQACAAALDAISQAGLGLDDLQNERSGLIFGCDSSSLAAVEQVEMVKEQQTTSVIGSGQVFCSMTSNVTMNLNTLIKTQGACWTLSAGCSSGGHAVGQAADLIRLGRQDRMICGGAQEVNWQSMCSFDALDAFSVQVGTPSLACRPFDVRRDGLVPSGGAAALILEDYELARKRHAPILGEIMGYGFSSDGDNIAIPSDTGLFRAMRAATKDANLIQKEIDYVCAHATGTPVGDGREAQNIHHFFGHEPCPPVASLKGIVGHELWMAGASQVVYCILMAQHGFTAANANFEEPDEYSRKISVLSKSLDRPPHMVLCNAAGFGGTNSCLAVRLES